ncbi:MAG: fibrobacter succinogenes major paralogous domain-containing protein, partial [Odoribacteraceae bacterium]|nr:fibrobacter succinogenes major paralogous domain-containing protein [Odoribacteraceae bacterium]
GAAGADRAAGVSKAGGLYYQFGRKDPFPFMGVLLYDVAGDALPRYHADADGISRVPGSTLIKTAVRRPSTYYASASEDWVSNNPYAGNSWNNPTWHPSPTGKGLFDPCPPGWKLPVITVWSGFILPGTVVPNAANYPDDYQDGLEQAGWEFYMGGVGIGETTFYPAAGLRLANGGGSVNMRSFGYYWSATPSGSTHGRYLWMSIMYGTSVQNEVRGHGMPVRCVQE